MDILNALAIGTIFLFTIIILISVSVSLSFNVNITMVLRTILVSSIVVLLASIIPTYFIIRK